MGNDTHNPEAIARNDYPVCLGTGVTNFLPRTSKFLGKASEKDGATTFADSQHGMFSS